MNGIIDILSSTEISLIAAGGIATPADAALMMQLGADGVCVGSGIFKSQTPERMAEAIVKATTHYDNDDILAEISTGLGEAMPGLQMEDIPASERLAAADFALAV